VLVTPGASSALVDALVGGAEIPGLTVHSFRPVDPGPMDERPITVDQTNASVVVGERIVVKWMREPRPDARAPMLLGHLAAVGFADMPTVYAALYRDRDLVAIVTAFLPEALDGWDWYVDALVAQLNGGPEADFAGALGVLTAELHVALASRSDAFPEPVTEAAGVDWAAAGLSVLAEAVQAEAELASDDDWVAAGADRLAAEIQASRSVVRTPVMHIHGDLHVGQVLQWRGGFAVNDFDGNPTVAPTTLEPAARDVAQMRTSLLHVGEMANRRTGDRHREAVHAWGARGAEDLLDSYLHHLAAHGLTHIFDAGLLRPFEVEQECRELLYAARFRPSWRYAPMGVLRSWFG
jgi:maltokinase